MSELEPIKVVADILAKELNLPAGQVMLAYERFTIPQNNGLYVALNYLGAKAIANNNYFNGNALVETQQVVMMYQIQIDLMSFDSSARTRKEEIYQALRSIYAQQAMEANGMQIARMPQALVNASTLEETKMLNRFIVTISVTALSTKEKEATSYYADFPLQIDENTTGKTPIYQPEDPFNG